MSAPSEPELPSAPERVSFGEALRVWTKIGLLSFGGPAGQIATMHRELVEKRRWVDEPRFLHALGYCMLLPGPEAQQLATYLGWMMHRTPGALAAGTLFILPGFLAILALSIAYATLGQLPLVASLFFGLKCAVLAMVVDAARRIGLRVLHTGALRLLAAAAFVAIFFFDVPFPLVVALAALAGPAIARVSPTSIPSATAHAAAASVGPSLLDRMAARGELAHTRPSWRRSLVVLGVGLALWAAPFVLLALFPPGSVLRDEATFFSGTAMITFGGAYAVLTYVAQRAVHDFGWLGAREMIDGLALAETTPGPLILVVELVGFLGAFHHPGTLSPLVAGTLGALVTVWVTFVPCFLWILLGGPYIEALREVRWIQRALTGVTAAVVGVIGNLSLWFALHVLFARVAETHVGPLRLLVPELASLDVLALVLSTAAILAVTFTKLGPMRVLGIAAAIGLLLRGVLGL